MSKTIAKKVEDFEKIPDRKLELAEDMLRSKVSIRGKFNEGVKLNIDEMADEAILEAIAIFNKEEGLSDADVDLEKEVALIKSILKERNEFAKKQEKVLEGVEKDGPEFVKNNKELYVEVLQAAFQPKQGQPRLDHTATQSVINSLQYADIDLGVRLERGRVPNEPQKVIFQARIGGEWVKLGMVDRENTQDVGRKEVKQATSATKAEANQDKSAQVDKVLKRLFPGLHTEAEKEEQEKDKAEKYQYDMDYPPMGADMRREFLQTLMDSREILSSREQDIEKSV
ncbi:MAG: hypothetical protein FWE31_01940 [Firmicutes bacterium]|nr:hypothetical protein [Bacillota bacterium]